MKNILFICCAIIGLIFVSNFMTKKNLIPEDAIRIRVIANSDSKEDQSLKVKVKNDVEKYLYGELRNIDNVQDADKVINNSLPNLDKIILKYTDDYKINYGLNYFPKKEYKSVVYDEGEYKSLVVTLGNGLGNNWWCVLFPPLCLMEAEEDTDVEYHSFIVDTIDKYFE